MSKCWKTVDINKKNVILSLNIYSFVPFVFNNKKSWLMGGKKASIFSNKSWSFTKELFCDLKKKILVWKPQVFW